MDKSSGWERPINAKKHHYFKAGEITSLCGKWMFYGTVREPDTFESPDDCKACRSALKKETKVKLSELETMENKDDNPVHLIAPLTAKIDKNTIEILVNGQQFAAVALDTLVEVKTVSRGLLAEITYRLEAMTRSVEPEPQEQREPYAWTWRDYEDTPAIFTEDRQVAEGAAIEGYKVTPLYR